MCVCVAAWPGLAWPSRGAKGRLPDFVSSFSAAALIKIITRVFFLFAFSVASALPLALALFLLPESRKFEAFYGRVSFRVCTLAQRPHCPGLCPPPPAAFSLLIWPLPTAIFESSAFPTRYVDGQLARPTQTDCNLNGVFSFFPPFS